MSAPENNSLFFDIFSNEVLGGQSDLSHLEAPALPLRSREGQIDCGSLEDCSANIISSKESRRPYSSMSELAMTQAQKTVDYHIGDCTIVGL